MKNNTIYLAGGFKSGWQDKIIMLLPDYIFFDPRKHELENPTDYTRWDLNAIKKSDLVIAYMEKGNPGGYALSLEIGYAKALDKRVVLVDEHDDTNRHRYFEMVREVSDECYDTFESFLKKLKQDGIVSNS